MEPITIANNIIFLIKFVCEMKKNPETIPTWGNLMNLLRRKSPETASALELAAQNPDNDNIAQSCGMLEEAAKSDAEIAAAVQKVVQSEEFINISKKMFVGAQLHGNAKVENLTQNNTFESPYHCLDGFLVIKSQDSLPEIDWVSLIREERTNDLMNYESII